MSEWPRCEACEFIGPDPSGFHADALALHRALHEAGRTTVDALKIPQLVRWLNGLLMRRHAEG